MSKSTSLLLSSNVDKFLVTLIEAERPSDTDKIRFVPPGEGLLDIAKARRPIVVFGRRGSGKTSLLAKARNELDDAGHGVAWVDLETFKNQHYPDVVSSILIRTFQNYQAWSIEHRPTIFSRPLMGLRQRLQKRKQFTELHAKIADMVARLESHLHSHDGASIVEKSQAETVTQANARVAVSHNGTGGDAGVSSEQKNATGVTVAAKVQKLDYLNRLANEIHRLLANISEVSGKASYLFFDDLYHFAMQDQPLILNHFHGLTKGANCSLKVGTIKHRSMVYVEGDQPIGMEIGHDAAKIDLDLSLTQFNNTKRFLGKILEELASECEIQAVSTIWTDTAFERMVLASGGVARDFISIARRSIQDAREKELPTVQVESVNHAASDVEDQKLEDVGKDARSDQSDLELMLEHIKSFCFNESKKNCFLVDLERNEKAAKLVNGLMDMRLIHKVSSSVSAPHRPGQKYTAFMLDLGQYVGERKRRGFEIVEFWKDPTNDVLRKAGLIFSLPNPDEWKQQGTLPMSENRKKNKSPRSVRRARKASRESSQSSLFKD